MCMRNLRVYLVVILFPMVVVGALHFNNMRYYDLNLGYDMPQHKNNTLALMRTGLMPPPPLTPQTYQAHQSPLFYQLSALYVRVADDVTGGNGFTLGMPVLLFILGMIWVVMVAIFVVLSFPQIPLLIRTLMICVVVLFPSNTIMSVMYTNDMPVTMLGVGAIWLLWLMCRLNRVTSRRWWLGAAILTGLATLFKLSGAIVIGTYGGLAIYIVLGMIRERRFSKARQVIIAAGLGLPIILTPWIINTRHASRYIDNPVGAITKPRYLWDAVTPSFFLSLDLNIFDMPFAYERGEGSYWTLQFLTLHNDYYNHWNSAAYKDYPPHKLATMPRRDPMPYSRLYDAITLQYLAIPITLVMVLGVGVSVYRMMFRSRLAVRDGSVLIVIYMGMAQAAQFIRFAASPDIRSVLIHARYLGFIYGFAFIIGGWWLTRFFKHRRYAKSIQLLFATLMVAYCCIAIRFMWLPPI